MPLKDPREHRVWSEWYIEATEHSRMKHTPHHLALLHTDICRRLNEKDAVIVSLMKEAESLRHAACAEYGGHPNLPFD